MRVPLCLAAALLISVSATASGASAPNSGPDAPKTQAGTSSPGAMAVIPGPLRSFLRMAGISQKVAPNEVLPLLAQNVVIRGYRGWGSDSQPTEYMTLLRRYVQQARELRNLSAAGQGTIRVETCEQAQPLLTVLGYKFRAGVACGQDTVLETADAQRAFLTLDSGFPLINLEQALAEKKPFTYEYPSSQVPVLFAQEDWTNVRGAYSGHRGDVIDALLVDPMLSRVYWAFARMDGPTRDYLKQSVGITRLLRNAPVFDFYSTQLLVRSGRIQVPGGSAAEATWQQLVGAPVTNPAEFVINLMSKDQGWLAAYFDSLSRATAEQQKYFVEPRHLKQFYEALLAKDPNPSPARPVFRSDPGMLLLINSLQFTKDGQPMVPGGLGVWNEIARQKGQSPQIARLAKRVGKFATPDELVAGMFTFSRADAGDSPLQLYLTISEIERRNTQPLTAQTVHLLASRYARFGQQYTQFSEFPELDNTSISRFVNVADAIDRIHDRSLRSDALGLFQANVSLWQILARQGQIPREQVNDSFQRTLAPFAAIRNSAQLFDSGRAALHAILKAASGRDRLSQEEIVSLLAGPTQKSAEAEQVHEELARNLQSVLQDQRLISLDTLWDLADGMKELAAGKPVADSLMPLARELREFEFPRPLFTKGERVQYAPSQSDSRHAESQTHIDLTPILKNANPKQLAEARGDLTPFLRDSLVGLNYAYYEPPGAQMLHHNPLFIRSHDFSGTVSPNGEYSWQTPQLFGSGVAAGRGAHLMGSLADLPYVLSEVEEDFIVPENVQALIWQELVPVLVTSAIVPRWWNVSSDELHAVALYQRTGEELLDAATKDEHTRQNVMAVLSDHVLMQRREEIQEALVSGHAPPQMLPGEAFYLAAEYRRRFAGENTNWGTAGAELDALAKNSSTDTNPERISHDFGVPHPILKQTYSRELVNVKPFPALMGYGSRLLAETWDSGNLYWARLADEMRIPPVQLNRLVPTLTRRMVEKIFATDFEDLAALSRAMQETGEEFRHRGNEPTSAAAPILTTQPASTNFNPQP